MDFKKLTVFGAVSICLAVLLMPDQRTDANLRKLFADRGMELVSIAPASGCYRVGSYRYEVRDRSGKIEHGLLCVNKSLHVLEMRRLPG
jgi:hypothetical protein